MADSRFCVKERGKVKVSCVMFSSHQFHYSYHVKAIIFLA